jgi:putative SOS response-associated peptidase YedK
MCGRLAQYSPALLYTEYLGLKQVALLFDAADQRPGFNLAPGSHPMVLFGDATLRRIHWGYRPRAKTRERAPYAVVAPVESAAHDGPFRALWQHGRVIVPADGWYEWRSKDGRNRPYFVRLQADAPMFLAALTNARTHTPHAAGIGLMLVTAAPEDDGLDAHARRPLVLSPAHARAWLDHDPSHDAMDALVASGGLPTDHFTRYPICDAIENPSTDNASLIEPQE